MSDLDEKMIARLNELAAGGQGSFPFLLKSKESALDMLLDLFNKFGDRLYIRVWREKEDEDTYRVTAEGMRFERGMPVNTDGDPLISTS